MGTSVTTGDVCVEWGLQQPRTFAGDHTPQAHRCQDHGCQGRPPGAGRWQLPTPPPRSWARGVACPGHWGKSAPSGAQQMQAPAVVRRAPVLGLGHRVLVLTYPVTLDRCPGPEGGGLWFMGHGMAFLSLDGHRERNEHIPPELMLG